MTISRAVAGIVKNYRAMKIFLQLMQLSLALLLTTGASLAQDWTTATKLLVQPGKAAGAIVLGQPLPANVTSLYGQPSTRSEPSPGSDGKDTGSVVFGSTSGFELKTGLLVKLNDGLGDDNVYTVFLRGVRAYTADGATMGISLAKARSLYPSGQVGVDEMTELKTLQIPGLVMLFSNDRLVEMVVRPK